MNKTRIIFLCSGIFILLMIFLFFIFYSYEAEEEIPCIDVNNLAKAEFVGCYDAYSKNIFLEVKENIDEFDIIGFDFLFFDYYDKRFSVNEMPEDGKSKSYKIASDRQPFFANIILKTNSVKQCETPKKIQLDYCSSDLITESVDLKLNLISEIEKDDFMILGEQDSDTISFDLVDNERTWEAVCYSKWDCDNWGQCIDGIQRRDCVDKENCVVPTDVPIKTKYCDGRCDENWICEWSECINGFSTPNCHDLNKCGTTYDKPEKISCEKTCSPELICGSWSSCNVDYDLLSVTNNQYAYKGIQSRICEDQSNCVGKIIEKRECSVYVDIYTKIIEKCGKEYIGIYNKLNNQLLARLEKGSENNPYVNINLNNQNSPIFCDYCFNGKLDGDEEQIDCGGSCMKCEDRIIVENFGQTIFSRFILGVKEFFQ